MSGDFEKYKLFLENIKVKEDLLVFYSEIEALSQGLYHVDKLSFETALNRDVRTSVADKIRKFLPSGGIDEHRDEIKRLLEGAKKMAESLHPISIALSFEPSSVIIDHISNFVRENFDPGLVMDLSLDRRIIGGAVITYKGKVYDFSVNKRLKEIFEGTELVF